MTSPVTVFCRSVGEGAEWPHGSGVEPLAVVDQLAHLLGQLCLEVHGLLVQRDGFQNIVRLVQDGTAGGLIDAAALMPTRRFSTMSSRPMPLAPPSLFRYSTSSTLSISLPSTAVGMPFSK